jgi:hypothetical protein
MKQFGICAFCLLGLMALALPLHAQSTVSPAAASAATFLSTLQTAAAPPAALPWLPASCTVAQCKANCACGAGCISVCTNLTTCRCTCKSTQTPPRTCEV